MKNFKKRTIALVLASVVTVAGSFASENFKNSIMALSFEPAGDSVNMVLETKKSYSTNIKPIQKDASTYVLMLPEVESKSSTPNLESVSDKIESVNIRTMPYTTAGKGYTKITVKLLSPVALTAENRVYISSGPEPELLPANSKSQEQRTLDRDMERYSQAMNSGGNYRSSNNSSASSVTEQSSSSNVTNYNNDNKVEQVDNSPVEETVSQKAPVKFEEDTADEAFMLVLGIFLVLAVVAFFAYKAREKMNELAGEKFDISDNDEKKAKKSKDEKKKNQSIRKTIKSLDSAYPTSVTMPGKTEYGASITAPVIEDEPEEINVVDLDELYQETTKNEKDSSSDMDENDALEDFLSGFSFDDEFEAVEEEVSPGYDVEFLEKLLSSEIKFTEDDIACLNELLNNEIQDDTIKNADQYLSTNPIKVSSKKVLEELVTTYSISQNIIFSSEDIGALNKLINVEIDKDFVTDLKTNPERTKEMYQEIEKSKEEYKKPSEIITLSVKDMLPDLSEALRQQGGRRIESEARAETVYFSEGYEVSKLAISDLLPDLSKELNNKDAYISKPSADIQYADNTYDVQTLSIKDELPDLNDAMANPEKYNHVEEEVVVADEEALLKNILDVQFKPFDDGTREFEILNDISVSDIQKEFSQFGNFEISDEEQYSNTEAYDAKDDGFDGLFSNEYVDLDNMVSQENRETNDNEQSSETLEELLEESTIKDEVSEPVAEPIVQAKSTEPSKRIKENIQPETVINNKSSVDLIGKLEEVRAKREDLIKKTEAPRQNSAQEELTVEALNLKYVINGKTYTVLDKAEFDTNAGCYLAKVETGYAVLGFVENNVVELHSYVSLKTERISARLGENLPDGTARYIIRAGSSKFIADYSQGGVYYVMDLC